ncbi:MAG TPA: tetratricopeptide repeat protein [Bryobacteraceae bacterium]|jgi:tetratricopeptide (TPR) repeat protein|nr:tetratricopeptide repeat protein [Bryobacteraceae bacterium]
MHLILFLLWMGAPGNDLEHARDAQDRAALERMTAQLGAEAQKQSHDAAAQYRYALAESYLAEVAIEQRDKNLAHNAAEAGIKAAQRAAALKPDDSEYHRIYGTLCGQAVSANFLQGMKYGKCAQEEVNKAVELDPKSAMNYLSQGVGNYYLPPALGGGLELAVKDFQKAIELQPKLAEAHLWLGLALRKENRNADARREFQRALELNPASLWTKEQLSKTPGS